MFEICEVIEEHGANWIRQDPVRRLNELGVPHRYAEFSDNHTGVDYRMDESLPFLALALSG
jgi:hypothetical protein